MGFLLVTNSEHVIFFFQGNDELPIFQLLRPSKVFENGDVVTEVQPSVPEIRTSRLPYVVV